VEIYKEEVGSFSRFVRYEMGDCRRSSFDMICGMRNGP
jgi:hypothetical protein